MLGKSRNLGTIGFGRVSLEYDVARAAAPEHLRLTEEPHPEAGWYFRSDQYSFAKRGVPTVTFRIGRDLVDGGLKVGGARAEDYNVKRYHQPGDQFDPKWTFAGSTQEATVAWRVGEAVANSDKWPAWRAGHEFEKVRASQVEGRVRGAALSRAGEGTHAAGAEPSGCYCAYSKARSMARSSAVKFPASASSSAW